MKSGWQFTKGFFTFLYLLVIFYLTLKNETLSQVFGFSTNIIPTISVVSIIFIGYHIVQLYINAGKLEREFTLIVNHTFRTPITSIMWFTKELEKDLPQKERLQYSQNITNTINKILSIVDIFAGIKNINDISGYFFEATSVREIVEKSMAKFKEEINKREITFKVSTFKDIPLLTVDLKKISFVVDSMLENAVLYTPKYGKILIDCLAEEDKISLYISDTGIGLTFAEKMRIFSRFYRSPRTKLIYPDGVGLRLYLSKKIIKRHKGKIYAKSKGENKGTTLIIELPIKR